MQKKRGYVNLKTSDGFYTSDLSVAAVLKAVAATSEEYDFEYAGAFRADELEAPGVFLRGEDGKEKVETDFSKAEEKIREFGFHLSGVFVPSGEKEGLVMFRFVGDPDKIYEAFQRMHGAPNSRGKRGLLVDGMRSMDERQSLLNVVRRCGALASMKLADFEKREREQSEDGKNDR